MTEVLKKLYAAVFSVALLTSCAGSFEDIKVKDVQLSGIQPVSSRTINLSLKVYVDNPSITFSLSGLEGTLMLDGTPFAKIECGEVTVEGHKYDSYPVDAVLSLCDGVRLSDALIFLGTGRAEDLKVDVTGVVRGPAGFEHKFGYTDIPLEGILNRI